MRVLVTGADGFVGRHLVAGLVAAGDDVTATTRPGTEAAERGLGGRLRDVPVLAMELGDDDSVRAAVARPLDAVVHLAALASGRDARRSPGEAWAVNAAGTARLLHALGAAREETGADPVVVVASSAEVYGAGPPTPRVETDPLVPCSPYGASKVGAEVAALEAWRTRGLRAVIARPFPHTGPGQSTLYALPAFVERLRAARREGITSVPVGNLAPVRDLLDVRDVVDAYLALIARGTPGEAYNVARGEGVTLEELFHRLAALVGARVRPRPEPSLLRAGDIPYLVGDPTKLCRATGWEPTRSLEQTLRGLVDAQAD